MCYAPLLLTPHGVAWLHMDSCRASSDLYEAFRHRFLLTLVPSGRDTLMAIPLGLNHERPWAVARLLTVAAHSGRLLSYMTVTSYMIVTRPSADDFMTSNHSIFLLASGLLAAPAACKRLRRDQRAAAGLRVCRSLRPEPGHAPGGGTPPTSSTSCR